MKVDHIHQKVELIIAEAKTHSLKNKLQSLSAVCEAMVKKKAELSIANVVTQLTNNKVTLSARTIYNDREGGNPYRGIFNVWAEYAKFAASNVRISVDSDYLDILSSDDINSIKDPVVKYRVNLLYAETIALRNQNRMLRQIKELPAVHSVPVIEENTLNAKEAERILLNSYEVELLKGMYEETTDIGFDENGGLIAKRPIRNGHRIVPPGLKETLEKIIRSYGADL